MSIKDSIYKYSSEDYKTVLEQDLKHIGLIGEGVDLDKALDKLLSPTTKIDFEIPKIPIIEITDKQLKLLNALVQLKRYGSYGA